MGKTPYFSTIMVKREIAIKYIEEVVKNIYACNG
jgi:hypothetical protein